MKLWIRRVSVFVGSLGLVGAIPFLSVPSLRHWIYKEASFQVILTPIIAGESDPEAVVERVVEYVHQQLYPGGGLPMDAGAWTHLTRGIGWCDQKAWTIGTLLALKGIHGRLVMLFGENGDSSHTVLEVLVDGQWRLVGPLRGSLFRKLDGSWGTLQDLSANPALLTAHPDLKALQPEARQEIVRIYQAILPFRKPPAIWESVLVKRRAFYPRVVAADAIWWLWAHLGRGWAFGFQDLYLTLLPQRMKTWKADLVSEERRGLSKREAEESVRLYFKARNYHLYGRWEKATVLYRRLVDQHPRSSLVEACHYWLGEVQIEKGNHREAIEAFTRFLNRWPDSAWKGRACDYLSLAYLHEGNAERGAYFSALALDDPYVPTANRVAGGRSFMGPAARSRL